jgi:hypothetical protein
MIVAGSREPMSSSSDGSVSRATPSDGSADGAWLGAGEEIGEEIGGTTAGR